MKTAIKVLVGLLIVGIIVSVVGLIIMDFDFSDIKSFAVADKDYTAAENTSEIDAAKISIEADDRIIKFTPSADGKYGIKYYQAEYDKVTFSEEGGVISIKAERDKRRRFLFRRASKEVRTVIVQVPEVFDGEIDVTTSNGDVSAERLAPFARLTLASTNGHLWAKDLTVNGQVRLNTSNGEIIIDTLAAGDGIIAKSSNGEIEIKAASATAIDADTSNGNIDLVNITCDNVSAKSSNGNLEITLYGQQQTYEIDVDTSNGSIRVGGIKVSSQIINSGAAKKLRAETSNGSIEVNFQ